MFLVKRARGGCKRQPAGSGSPVPPFVRLPMEMTGHGRPSERSTPCGEPRGVQGWAAALLHCCFAALCPKPCLAVAMTLLPCRLSDGDHARHVLHVDIATLSVRCKRSAQWRRLACR